MTHCSPLRRRALVPLLTTALTTLLLGLAASPAAAQTDEDVITRYDLAIDLGPDGVADVQLDLEADFGERPNHGPYLTYPVKQRFDDERDRVYRISDVQASSPTAPSAVDVEEEGAALVIRVGDEDEEITGTHEYTVTFQVEGWINSASYAWPDTRLDTDQLYLNVLTDWQLPVQDVTVTVGAPAEPQQLDCFAGPEGSQGDCSTLDSAGRTATFTQDRVEPGDDLTVAAAYPPGTFGGAEPILQDRWAFSRAFALTPLTGGAGAVLALGGVALVVHRVRRTGRDRQYLGLTPGLQPAGSQQHDVGPRTAGPVAVQFTPPAGLRPGQLGTLVDEYADPHDVTATLVDLAVRGYLRIEQVAEAEVEGEAEEETEAETSESDWRLVRLDAPDGDLLEYEQLLMDEVFDDRETVTLSDLSTTFASSMAQVQEALYEDVTERRWFRGNPKHARDTWGLRSAGLLVVGVLLTVGLAIWTSWALVGLAVVVVGVVAASVTKAVPARTAKGSAVLAQAEGFRLYLETAEADQLRFEEGQDLFSRYLPFAVAFGLTERWAGVFADLAARGHALPEPTWYVGPAYAHGAFWATSGAFTRELTSFTHMADTAIAAPTPGSSGSSGIGAGGFAGGGVGGGGGGSW